MAYDVTAGRPLDDAESDQRRQYVIGAAAVLLLLLGGLIWWQGSDDATTQACTTAGAVGAPIAESSEAAFEAWFAESGASASMGWVDRSGVAPPELADYEQTGDQSWEWRYQDNASVLVETSRRDDHADGSEQWAVSGVNGCTYS